jgi:pimeloyl-ACP methyl ester carboxylesterase
METAPVVLVPGLGADARLYAGQIPALWRFGPVTVANQTRQDSMAAIAADILAHAPPRFALAGLSMGGYVAFEILRQAPERVLKLALLDTTARPDTPEQSERRCLQIETARSGRYGEIPALLFPALVHASRRNDEGLRAIVDAMFFDIGPEAHIRQQTAIMNRPDSRPTLSSIRCPVLVAAGDGDELTPPAIAAEMAGAIAGARLAIVPDCGHLSTLERPGDVSGLLAQWMRA